MSTVLAFRKQRQEDHLKFKDSLVYIGSSRLDGYRVGFCLKRQRHKE